MPKVETSLNTRGLYTLRTGANNVSNIIGDNDTSIGNYNKIHFRIKRDLISFNKEKKSAPKRRIVKKLIRVQPIYNSKSINDNHVDTSTESQVEITTRRRKYRRKLIIKKKKRKLNTINLNIDEHLQQATKPRRKVIITRKRLLPNPNKTITIHEPSETFKQEGRQSKRLHVFAEDNDEEEVITTTETTFNQNVGTTTEGLDEQIEDDENEEDDDDYNDDEEEFDEEDDSGELDDNEDDEEDSIETSTEDDKENSIPDDSSEVTTENPNNKLPDYEPFFPELSESLDVPVLLLKTTVLSSVEQIIKTIVQSRLRTYTYVVTRVHGTEQIVTSTTEVKPQIKTTTLTESLTKYTTLTLLDFDASSTLTTIPNTLIPTLDNPQLSDEGESFVLYYFLSTLALFYLPLSS